MAVVDQGERIERDREVLVGAPVPDEEEVVTGGSSRCGDPRPELGPHRQVDDGHRRLDRTVDAEQVPSRAVADADDRGCLSHVRLLGQVLAPAAEELRHQLRDHVDDRTTIGGPGRGGRRSG